MRNISNINANPIPCCGSDGTSPLATRIKDLFSPSTAPQSKGPGAIPRLDPHDPHGPHDPLHPDPSLGLSTASRVFADEYCRKWAKCHSGVVRGSAGVSGAGPIEPGRALERRKPGSDHEPHSDVPGSAEPVLESPWRDYDAVRGCFVQWYGNP